MDLLPDSRLRVPRGIVRGEHSTSYKLMLNWAPIYCANCGRDGGAVPADTCNFAFYLCEPCAEKLPPIEGTYVEPDIVFWQKVKEAQLEAYGQELTPAEIVEALKDGNHMLSKLARERKG
jgi:hypothetical protein